MMHYISNDSKQVKKKLTNVDGVMGSKTKILHEEVGQAPDWCFHARGLVLCSSSPSDYATCVISAWALLVNGSQMSGYGPLFASTFHSLVSSCFMLAA